MYNIFVMFKKIFLISLLFSTFYTVFPQETNYNLSKESVISLITMEPTVDHNNHYGHSAIRIYDINNNIDELFDLCYYDKHTNLSYKMHLRFIEALKKDQLNFSRNWYEQELNLTHEEKKKVFELLILSCNGPYYGFTEDFFTESAPIKIHSMLKLILGDKLHIQSGKITLRTILNNDFISQNEIFLNNIFYGTNADNPLLTLDCCYTPEQLKMIAAKSKLTVNEEITEDLVTNERSLVNCPSLNHSSFFTINLTVIILSSILTIIFLLTIIQLYLNSREIRAKSLIIGIKAFDLIFFVSVGLVGCKILTNDCLSTNLLYTKNYNFIWLVPSNLIMAFTLISNKKNTLFSLYWLFNFFTILTFISLHLLNIINQTVTIPNILLMSAISIRCLYHFIRFYPFKTKQPVLNQEPAVLE